MTQSEIGRLIRKHADGNETLIQLANILDPPERGYEIVVRWEGFQRYVAFIRTTSGDVLYQSPIYTTAERACRDAQKAWDTNARPAIIAYKAEGD